MLFNSALFSPLLIPVFICLSINVFCISLFILIYFILLCLIEIMSLLVFGRVSSSVSFGEFSPLSFLFLPHLPLDYLCSYFITVFQILIPLASHIVAPFP